MPGWQRLNRPLRRDSSQKNSSRGIGRINKLLEMQVALDDRFCSGTKRNRGKRILLFQKVNAIFLIYIHKALDPLLDGVGVQILFHDPDLCVVFFQKGALPAVHRLCNYQK